MASPATERAGQMFPVLTAAQVQRIEKVGRRREIAEGQLLFDAGDQNTCFFVVLSGAIAIEQPVGDVMEPIVVHGPGQFTGEINMLSARRSLVRGARHHAHRGDRRSTATTCATWCSGTPS